ncbi:YdbH domain-containing protein [Phenylobacterium sp.]|uniref:intermembrane phospholipid transport protein YdbH family protein n=1 Tax=Phenylobacterium sp. TaxID=1871053 RepID=UPI002615BB18|nr:YdbH domain-containing protein [Phenylobacterium sp.]
MAARARRPKARWLVLAVVALLLIALAIAYAARRHLAREALVGWLQSRGVEADASFEALGPRGLVGQLRIGPADSPIVTADRAEVSYRLTGPWRGEAFGVEIAHIRLVRPDIRMQLTETGVSLGPLDPLIAEFRARPARTDSPAPEIVVEDGVLRVAHASGQAVIHADAHMSQGVLVSLSGRMEPTRFETDALMLDIADARVGLVTRAARTSLSFVGALRSGRLGETAFGAGALNLAAAAAYPDLEARAIDGPVVLVADLNAAEVSHGEIKGERLRLNGSFRGAAQGALDQLSLRGQGSITAGGEGLSTAGISLGAVKASAASDDLAWRRGEGGGFTGAVRTSLEAERVASGDLALERASANLDGAAAYDGAGFTLDLSGPVAAAGGWAGLGAVTSDDFAELAAIKRAAADFSLAAPGVRLALGPGGLQVGLTQAATVRTAAGGLVRLRARAEAPLYGGQGGAMNISTSGGGLPRLEAQIAGYSLDAGKLTATTRLAFEADFGPLRGMKGETQGRLNVANGRMTFRADACAPFEMARLETGETSVIDIEAELCPTDQPLVVVQGGQWALDAAAKAARADIPFLLARASDAAADLRLGTNRGGLFVEAQVARARVSDTSPEPRFHPLDLTGVAGLQADAWTGALDLASGGHPVAEVGLRHNGLSGTGGVTIDTGTLTFTAEGLQPAALSPLAEVIGGPVEGAALFTGAIDWSAEGVDSHGRLDVPGLDFKSPAGDVQGLSGQIDFTSLVPLQTAPGQTLTAEVVQALAPLTGSQVTFQLLPEELTLSEGTFEVGGGAIRIAPMSIPLDQTQSWRGELVIEAVQLSEFVEATPFADRVDLDAVVSGRLPFVIGPDGITFIQGKLTAIAPGRLSIRREALTQVDATGGAATASAEGLGDQAVPVAQADQANAAVDFAYQAMEHLAFDLLDAEVNSLPGGRLGVLFKIRGEHSPPQRQEIRLTLGELISRSFLDKELPLPSGTKVDLTLDTSLNLDELLADYAAAQAVDGSGAVQPPAP